MSAESPSVSVIIPSLNTRDLLADCLASMVAQSMWSDCEAIVVDMSSNDGTVEMLETRFPSVHIVREAPNRGYGAACNLGASLAAGQWLLLLNSDVRLPDRDTMKNLLGHTQSWSGDALFGVRLVGTDGVPQRSARGLPGRWALSWMFCAPLRYMRTLNDRALRYLDEGAMTKDTVVGWVTGAVLLMHRELFDRLGGFDESFFMNSEEIDLAARVAEAGGDVVFVPEVTVLHYGGGSTSSKGDGLRWLAEGQVRYTRKHFGRFALGFARAAAVLAFASSVPVWMLRALFGRQTPSEAMADARAYASALGRALRV